MPAKLVMTIILKRQIQRGYESRLHYHERVTPILDEPLPDGYGRQAGLYTRPPDTYRDCKEASL